MGGGSCINTRGGRSGLTLYTEYYERKFITGNVCSMAFLFHVFVIVTLIVLTFVLTFSSGGKNEFGKVTKV